MDKIVVAADKRNESGKGSARSLRRAGILPAIVYSAGKSTPIQINTKIMTKLLTSGVAEHSLITVELNEDGSKTSEHPVLIKDYQLDPVSDELLHVDFIEISLKDKVTVTVPVLITKQPVGVKMGGILQKVLREVEIECLPTQIPDSIDVDAEHIDIGGNLHVSDLTVPDGAKILTDLAGVILSVKAPVIEEEKPEEEVLEEGAEPELVGGKGKDDEEGEGEEKKEEGK
jgi:large subunit ribosomal protein L25